MCVPVCFVLFLYRQLYVEKKFYLFLLSMLLFCLFGIFLHWLEDNMMSCFYMSLIYLFNFFFKIYLL